MFIASYIIRTYTYAILVNRSNTVANMNVTQARVANGTVCQSQSRGVGGAVCTTAKSCSKAAAASARPPWGRFRAERQRRPAKEPARRIDTCGKLSARASQ